MNANIHQKYRVHCLLHKMNKYNKIYATYISLLLLLFGWMLVVVTVVDGKCGLQFE